MHGVRLQECAVELDPQHSLWLRCVSLCTHSIDFQLKIALDQEVPPLSFIALFCIDFTWIMLPNIITDSAEPATFHQLSVTARTRK